MYLKFLKNDIKKKITINIILLLFIVLSSMFISSSVNNIVTTFDAIDDYLYKAGVKEYLIATLEKGESTIKENLETNKFVESFNIEDVLYVTYKDIFLNDAVLEESDGTSILITAEQAGISLFDENNKVIDHVNKNEILISAKTFINNNINIGDFITFRCGEYTYNYKVAGSFKDAALGAEMIGMNRYLISQEDYEEIATNNKDNYFLNGTIAYVDVSDRMQFEKEIGQKDNTIISLISRDILKMAYIMNIILAGILTLVSICLVLIALVVLKFTISFTITQEYKEIGVMKAIGITNIKIRLIYLIKYIFIAMIGTVVGFIAGIPFGKLMLKSISFSIILESKSNLFINLICSLSVILIVLIFCLRCTRKINKLYPVNAIKNGNVGESFKKKSLLKLKNSHLNTICYMAFNDVLSSIKKYSIVAIAFSLCLLIQLVLVNSRNTLISDDLNKDFGFRINDIYIVDIPEQFIEQDLYASENAQLEINKGLNKMEEVLKENNIQATCNYEMSCSLTIKYKDNITRSLVMQGVGNKAEDYKYYEGTPPQNAKEIALTKITAQKINANIGDIVEVHHSDGIREYLVTALFQSMNNLGDGARFHETNVINGRDIAGCINIGIIFLDSLDEKEVEERIIKIKDIFNTKMVYTPGEYLDGIIGITESIKGIEKIVMTVSVLILAFIAVLMEYSFVLKERGEIAVMKSIGFKSKDIIKIHILRFLLTIFVSILISFVMIIPVTKLMVGPIFGMMGASYGIDYKIIPLEVFVIYPLIMAAATLISVGFTSLRIRAVKTAEVTRID